MELEARHGVGGIDPHKHSATLAVIDSHGHLIDVVSVAVTPAGIDELLEFLTDTELVIDRIGVEGSAALGLPVAAALSAAGYDVREVQPNRTAERRRRRRRAKTDIEDAGAIARETLAAPQLPPAGKHAAPEAAWEELTAVHDWRDSLILQRVRQLTEAESVLVSLPLSIRSQLPSTSRVLPQLEMLESLDNPWDGHGAVDQVRLDRLQASLDDIRLRTGRIKALDKKIPPLLEALSCTLTEICDIGPVTAMD